MIKNYVVGYGKDRIVITHALDGILLAFPRMQVEDNLFKVARKDGRIWDRRRLWWRRRRYGMSSVMVAISLLLPQALPLAPLGEIAFLHGSGLDQMGWDNVGPGFRLP
jgi:hypothetical protein